MQEPLRCPRHKSTAQVVLMCINITLSFFYFGYALVYLGVLPIETILANYRVTFDPSLAQGILNGCIPIGGLIGAYLSSCFIDRLSRRQYLILVNSVAFAAGCVVFIPNFYTLTLGRLVQGMCVGMYTAIVNMIVKQLSPVQISGTLGTFPEFGASFGIVFAYGLVYVLIKATGDVSGEQYWVVIFGVLFIPLIVQTLVLLFVYPYETPKYWLQQGRQDKAKQLICELYHEEYVEEVLREKIEDLRHIEQVEAADSNEEHSNVGINVLMALQMAAILQLCGNNVVTVYASDMLKHISNQELMLISPTFINLTKTLFTIITACILKTQGRKSTLQIGYFFLILAEVAMGLGYLQQKNWGTTSQILVLGGALLFMAIYGLTLGPIIWLYIPEIVSPKVLPYTSTVFWISSSLLIFLFPIIQDHILEGNPGAIFFFFGLLCLVSFVFNQKYMVESQGKTEKQIRQEYEALRLC